MFKSEFWHASFADIPAVLAPFTLQETVCIYISKYLCDSTKNYSHSPKMHSSVSGEVKRTGLRVEPQEFG